MKKKLLFLPTLLLIPVFLVGCSGNKTANISDSVSDSRVKTYEDCIKAEGKVDDEAYPEICKVDNKSYINKDQELTIKEMGKHYIKFETNFGNFEVELDGDKAPITVSNFLNYVKNGYFDGLVFHRIIKDFMVQGGGFDQDNSQKETKDPIKNEADNGLKNEKYTIAMARTNEVDSATSQFFINMADNDFLDHSDQNFGYAVFGKVIEGKDVLDKIEDVEVEMSSTGEASSPTEMVIMEKVSEIKK